MDILGNVNLKGNELQNGKFETLVKLPLDPKVGTWAFIDKTLMLCIEVEEKPLWVPLSPERNTVVRDQSIVSATWIVDHNFDRDKVMVQCFDVNNRVIIPDTIEPIDSNSTRITFSDPIKGSTIAMFGYEEGTSISSGELNNNGGGGVPVSTVTSFVSKESMLKFGAGFIGLDGQDIDYRTFPQLYLALGGVEGSTDLITLPDANGTNAFFRGGRTSPIGFSTIQEDAIKAHYHDIQIGENENSAGLSNDSVIAEGTNSVLAPYDYGIDNEFTRPEDSDAIKAIPQYLGDASLFAAETRPVNFSGYWGIKAFGAEVVEGVVDISSMLTRITSLESELATTNESVGTMNQTIQAMGTQLAKNKDSRARLTTDATIKAVMTSGDMFGDTNLTYSDLTVNALRSGDAVSISGSLTVAGFTADLDNDAACYLRINSAKLGDALDLYSGIRASAFGVASFQFYEDGGSADCLANSGYVEVDSTSIKLRLLESVSASGTQRTDRAIVRFAVTFTVS